MRRIVVGVDGSAGAKAALRWAVDEARRRRAKLEVIHAWMSPWAIATVLPGVSVLPESTRRQYGLHEIDVLEGVVHEVVGDSPADLELETRTLEGDPGTTLVRAALGADLLVVGSRGLGSIKGALMGSVSHYCVQHAPCPVVVVPVLAKPVRAAS